MGDWSINASELDGLVQRLDKACANMNAIAKKSVDAAVPRIESEMSRKMPKSEEPRLPGVRDNWRTGKHAADDVRTGLFKTSLHGSIYKVIGPSQDDPYFYMRFIENGRRVFERRPKRTLLSHEKARYNRRTRAAMGYQPPQPYMQGVVDSVREDTINTLREVLLKELELFD
jgi:HK97 gp10 family phage protein